MKFLIAIAPCLLLLSSCQTVVDIDVPLEDRKIVVNALNNTDSLWRVDLSLSRHILDDVHWNVVPNAEVSVVDPASNLVIDQLQLTGPESRYTGSKSPEAGKDYLLRVSVPGYEMVEARERFPTAVPIESVSIDSSGLNSDDRRIRMALTFSDPPSEENYYEVVLIWETFYIMHGDTIRSENLISIEADDPALKGNGGFGNILFRDNFFNGKNYTLALSTFAYSQHYGSSYRIVFKNVSKSYYEYKSTLDLQRSVSGDPFAQPVLVFNNIQNGFGIFGGYNQSVWVLSK